MPCTHKFWSHEQHLLGNHALLPEWRCRTLIIGTFNPENIWVPDNEALYYYGRSLFFWNVTPKFAGLNAIANNNLAAQFEFLINYQIGLTDLIIRINDADINNPEHLARVRSYRDADLELFNNFTWNTPQIINYINQNQIEAVYFSRLGLQGQIGIEIQSIIDYCNENNIINNRLHTPSGQGLHQGIPRENKLIHKWYHENGADQFPFLQPEFDINAYPFH